MAIFQNSLVPTTDTGYDIANSCRFNDDDTAYLSWTPSSAGSTTWTFSVWVKQGNITTANLNNCIFAANGGHFALFFQNYQIRIWEYNGSGVFYTKQLFRDPSAWYHIVLKRYTTTPFLTLYVNGVEVPDAFKFPSENVEDG